MNKEGYCSWVSILQYLFIIFVKPFCPQMQTEASAS